MKVAKNLKPQASRIIQSNKGVRQRVFATHNFLIQRAYDLSCKTEIDYIHKGNKKHSTGIGMNNSADKQDVLITIGKHSQTNWISKLNAVANSNAPGQCAEPHSLAKALEPVHPTDKIMKVTQGPAIFIKDYYDYHLFRINNTEFKALKKDYPEHNSFMKELYTISEDLQEARVAVDNNITYKYEDIMRELQQLDELEQQVEYDYRTFINENYDEE